MPSNPLERRLAAWKKQARAAGQLGRFLVDNPEVARDLAVGAARSVAAPVTSRLPGAAAPSSDGPVSDALVSDAPGPAAVPPAGLASYPRTAGAEVLARTSPARTRRVLEDLSRLPEWLTMHAGWRGTPPTGAAVGVAFTETVSLMGIPADLAWTVDEVDATRVAMSGRGPMGLTLGLWLTVLPATLDGVAGSRVRVDAGVGGDPVQGPMGATILRSVADALEESLARLGTLLEDEAASGADDETELLSSAPVLHVATGRLLDARTPVVVGVGQVTRRTPDLDALADPATLAAEALRAAADDCGVPDLLGRADAVYAVASASWSYRDLGAAVAEQVGVAPRETVMSARYGGDAGQVLVNTAGQAIVDGEVDVVLVCGAEAGNTLAAAQKAGVAVEWPTQGPTVAPTRVVGSEREANNEAETAAGLSVPVYTYALMESALRRSLGETPAEHTARIAALWSGLSEVAAENPHAWQPEAVAAEDLATASADNRAVSAPYTKLLCANLQVDLAAGLVVTSVAAAHAAGVPQEKWVFLHAGAAAYDEWFVSERAELDASPAIRTIGQAALAHAGLAIEDVAHVDLYSCFPSAVQIAAKELGLPVGDPDRPLSVTGGLTFAGGPGNNYGTHAVATLVGRLREDPTAYGLSTSLGWFATKHALGIYSATPPQQPYRALHPVLEPTPKRPAPVDRTGTGVVEAATVQFDRDGKGEVAIVAVLLPDGARVLVRTAQPEVVAAVLDDDPLGWTVEVEARDALRVLERGRAELPHHPR